MTIRPRWIAAAIALMALVPMSLPPSSGDARAQERPQAGD